MSFENADWDYYDVEDILKRKREKDKNYYLVKWTNYNENEATWEPEDNLEPELVAKFEKRPVVKRTKQAMKSASDKLVVGRDTEEPKIRKQVKRDREEETKQKELVIKEKKTLKTPVKKSKCASTPPVKKQARKEEIEVNEAVLKEQKPVEKPAEKTIKKLSEKLLKKLADKPEEKSKPEPKEKSGAGREQIEVKVVGVKNGSLLWEIKIDGELKEMNTEDACKIACKEMVFYLAERTVLTMESSKAKI